MLERAIAIAAKAHQWQTDKAGAPYILHPPRVMLAVSSEVERIAAVLHDVVEDCPEWPLGRLEEEGFSEEVLAALDALTRRRGEDYGAFIERVKVNPVARRVKLADLADNSDLSRIANPSATDLARTAKYIQAQAQLAA